MRIGLAQIQCAVDDVPANCAKFRLYAQRASACGCQVLAFPELSDSGYMPSTIAAHACSWSELPVRTLQDCGATYGLYIIAGLSERAGEGIYNSLAIISPAGALIGRYRKAHLFAPAPSHEDQFFARGSSLTTLSIGGLTWGFSICYDLRFPELYRSLALRGAEVLLVSAAWPTPRPTHWETLTAARAIENQAYMLAVNRVGTDNGLSFCGRSCIVAPSGESTRLGAEEEALLVGEIDRARVLAMRESMPVFRHRRVDLYEELNAPSR